MKLKMTAVTTVLLLRPQVVYAYAFEVPLVHGSNHDLSSFLPKKGSKECIPYFVQNIAFFL